MHSGLSMSAAAVQTRIYNTHTSTSRCGLWIDFLETLGSESWFPLHLLRMWTRRRDFARFNNESIDLHHYVATRSTQFPRLALAIDLNGFWDPAMSERRILTCNTEILNMYFLLYQTPCSTYWSSSWVVFHRQGLFSGLLKSFLRLRFKWLGSREWLCSGSVTSYSTLSRKK